MASSSWQPSPATRPTSKGSEASWSNVWVPLSLTDTPEPHRASVLAKPSQRNLWTPSLPPIKARAGLQPKEEDLPGHMLRADVRLSASFRSSKNSLPTGDNFFHLLAETRQRTKVLHTDPFDTIGPQRMFKHVHHKPEPNFERSLNIEDPFCGFPAGSRAAFKATGDLMTVLGPGHSHGVIDVQLDPQDIDEEGDIVAVHVKDLMLPTREELLALQGRKGKTEA